MKRLLFGGGYLGGRVASAWLAAGDDVTVLTRSAESAKKWKEQGVTAVVGNVCEPATLRFDGPFDSALYCVGYDRNSGADRRDVSVGGVANVIAAVGEQVERWVLTSTTSVFGQDGGAVVDESSETVPTTDNGRIAVDAEAAMRTAGGTILRLAGLYGPGRLLAREATLRGETPMPGSGKQWLNLIHVEDAAAACLAASDEPWPALVLTCDNEPVRRADYYGHLASLRRLPGPTFDGEPRVGRGSSDKRCDNALLRSLCPPRVAPTYREGLAAILAAEDAVT